MNTIPIVPSCTGPCEQGKFKCKTPLACEIPESEVDALGSIWANVFLAAIGLVALLLALSPALLEWL